MKRCLLCKREAERLARAHIFALGFFRGLRLRAQVDTVATSTGDGRRLQSALYDSNIICDECEHNIMSPLDEYGIQILRDRKGAMRIPLPAKSPMGMFVFEGVDKCKLRAFLASVLWRCSVSKQLEVRDISIGDTDESRIRQDLVSSGDFPYVDMVLFYLTHPLHGAFLVPVRKRLRPLDRYRDQEMVNGWILQFPNISITLSLDKRPHPHRMFFSLDTELTGREDALLTSTCLLPEADQYDLLALESHVQKNHLHHIVRAMQQQQGRAPENKPLQATRYPRT